MYFYSFSILKKQNKRGNNALGFEMYIFNSGEQELICNQQVGGSSPSTSSNKKGHRKSGVPF